MKIVPGLAVAAVLAVGAAGGAHAQLKPSSPDILLPPTSNEARKQDAQSVKELAARSAAEKWLALLDAGEFGKAWDQGAKLFRERVPRARWVEQLPKDRAFGKLLSRRAEGASFKPSLPGAPDGEYVTLRFSASFDKKSDAEEAVTLVYEDGGWRPLGYGIR